MSDPARDFTKERRHLLRSAAWIGASAVFAVTRRAEAWQVEEVSPTSALGLAFAKRCGGPADHAALIAQLQAELSKEDSATSLTATCPICGCPIIVSR